MIEAMILNRANSAAKYCLDSSRRNRTESCDIARQAQRRLQKNPYVALRTIRCECDQDVLVLRGQVASYHLKQLAHHAVRTIEGVRIVNDIKVRRTASR